MSDLIRREDALMCARPEYLNPNQEKLASYNQGWNNAIEMYYRQIAELSPAEPKVGKWEKCRVVDIKDTTITEIQYAYCPICQKYHTTPYLYYFDYFKYCPNCGAKMERSE